MLYLLCATVQLLTDSAVEVAPDEVTNGCEGAYEVCGVAVGSVARTQRLVEAAGSEKRLERRGQLVLAMRNVEVAQDEDQLRKQR